MIVGESRDQHQHHLLPATAAATAISSFSSHLKSSHPLRKRALTSSYHSSSIESPSLPSPSAPRHAPLYDRRRPSVRNLSLSNVPNPSSPSLSPIPNSKQNRNSLNVLPLSSPLSPNAPKRELSRHISHHAVRSDVNTTMPSTVAYDEDSALTGQSGRAMNGVDRDQEEAPRTPLTADAAPRNEEDIFLNIARSDPSRRGSLGLSELKRVS